MPRRLCLLRSLSCEGLILHEHDSLRLPLSVDGHGCAEVTGAHTIASHAEEPSHAVLTPGRAWSDDPKHQQQMLSRYCDVHDQSGTAAKHYRYRQGHRRDSYCRASHCLSAARILPGQRLCHNQPRSAQAIAPAASERGSPLRARPGIY